MLTKDLITFFQVFTNKHFYYSHLVFTLQYNISMLQVIFYLISI